MSRLRSQRSRRRYTLNTSSKAERPVRIKSARVALAVSVPIAALILVGAACLGSVFVPPTNLIAILVSRITGSQLPEGITALSAGVVWNLRIARVLLAFLAGAALATSGAVMQSVLRNPLASAYTLGVSSGASLGAGLVMLAEVSIPIAGAFALPFAGFASSLLAMAIVMGISRAIDPRLDNDTIILAGMVFSLFVSAILTLLSALSGQEMSRLMYWQMGSFALRGWEAVAILAPVLACALAALMVLSRELDILTFGEDEAASIGVPVRAVKPALIAVASALAGCTIAFTGVIGFLDLAVPHAVRRVFGPSHRRVIPFSALAGGTLMVVADLIARTMIPPLDLPVGAVTAILGAPFFAWVFFRSRRGRA